MAGWKRQVKRSQQMFNIEDQVFGRAALKKLLPVKMSAKIEIELIGLLAKTKLIQTYTNTTDEPIEAVHAIPVPVESSLVSFTVRKNQKSWVGQVLPKSQADQAYEAALEEGDSAFQLKQSKEDVYTLYLGNLLSKETLSIEFELVFPIQWIAGQGQLYLPLVMGERYGKSNLLPEENPTSSFLAEYPLELTLKPQGQLAKALIESPSHPLLQQGDLYTLQGKGYLDRDLKINFSQVASIEPSFMLMDSLSQNRPGLVTIFTEPQEQTTAQPRDILFLLDGSGSMQGTPITQLKKVMRSVLNQMRPQDRFNLHPFGSEVESVFETIQPVNEETIVQAKRYLRRHLDANLGGTETVRALLTALMSYQKTQATDIVLITDGNIWFNEESIEMRLLKAYASQNNIRIFTIGVGHATTEKTVKYLAEISGGSYVLTNPHEDIGFIIESHFKRLFNEPLSVTVKTPNEWHKLPTVYQGDVIQIPIWFHELPGFVEVEVSSATGTQVYQLKPESSQNKAAEKWIASQRYQVLPESEQVAFAMEYQLLTDKTDYLVELQRAESEKSDAIPGLVKMPQMNVLEAPTTYMDIPAFLRRQADPLDAPRFSHKGITDTVKNLFKENPETMQIKQFIVYVTTLIEAGSEPDYQQLIEFGLPEGLIDLIRLSELQGQLNSVLVSIIEHAKECKVWREFSIELKDYSL
jgi:Ca-activated chloride channel family protein